MFTAFSTALSALGAHTTAVDVVGNNLANLNTTGFKEDKVFYTYIKQSIAASQDPANLNGVINQTVQASSAVNSGATETSTLTFAASV